MLGSRTKLVPCFRKCITVALRSQVTKASVNGVEIAYEKVGSGERAVLLLPGALGCGKTDFVPQIEGINREKFTVIALDPRGYGASIPPERDFPLDAFERDANDAAKLMENLGFLKYSLMGWSDGANTAVIVAAKHQDKVDKLVIWGGNSFVTKEELEMYEKVRDISGWSERMRKPMVDLYGEEYFRKTWNAWVDSYIDIFRKKNGNVCLDEVTKVTASTLIIHGMKDAMVPLFHAQHFHNNIKGSILDCWQDGKHNLHLKYANRFNAQIEDFILRD